MSNASLQHSLAGSVILYNPASDVPNNVASYIDSLDWHYVVDNQNGKTAAERIVSLAPEQVIVLANAENEGIAKPLNKVLGLCAGKADLLMTMDQDSHFLPGHMASYRTALDSLDWTELFGLGPTSVPKTSFDKNKSLN